MIAGSPKSFFLPWAPIAAVVRNKADDFRKALLETSWDFSDSCSDKAFSGGFLFQANL